MYSAKNYCMFYYSIMSVDFEVHFRGAVNKDENAAY